MVVQRHLRRHLRAPRAVLGTEAALTVIATGALAMGIGMETNNPIEGAEASPPGEAAQAVWTEMVRNLFATCTRLVQHKTHLGVPRRVTGKLVACPVTSSQTSPERESHD